jgi:hypothetical protein
MKPIEFDTLNPFQKAVILLLEQILKSVKGMEDYEA